MKLRKSVIYFNLAALTIDGLVLWLGAVKVWPPMVGATVIAVFLAGAIWLSCYLNGQLPKKARRVTFHAAPTERVERI
ncbi:MAG: hypothetical protein M3Y81_25485 [Chloroflexota bacterium]|nr:hypothetical protein [Chloroflexota bacterium]